MPAIVFVTACAAFASHAADVKGTRPEFLVKVWLTLPHVERVAWPYAYIRLRSTDEDAARIKKDLFAELDRLTWRLEPAKYASLRASVQRWRKTLEQIDRYRQPGQWSPAWVMAHPRQMPPLARVAAVGACALPKWIEIWDGNGIHRQAWEGGLRLSDVLARDPLLAGARGDEVALVRPEGRVEHYGVAAWNYADTALQPGTRIVAALPLDGAAFPYIRDTIAQVLARSRPGDECRESRILQGPTQ